MRDQEPSRPIADIVRRLDVLGRELGSRPDDDHPPGPCSDVDIGTEALINDVAGAVDRLRRHVDRLRRPIGSVPVGTADAASDPPFTFPIEWSRELDLAAHDAARLERTHGPTPSQSRGAHGVHFSRSHDHTVAAIIEMFDDARAQGRPAVVVATRMHRRWIEADLHQRCIAFEGDVCRLLDADTTLASILLDGEPDRDHFRSVIGTLLADICARHPGGVSVYGEMVGLLWSEGRVGAALRLEELWGELQCELPFSLLCGYLIEGSPDSPDLDPIRHLHTYVG